MSSQDHNDNRQTSSQADQQDLVLKHIERVRKSLEARSTMEDRRQTSRTRPNQPISSTTREVSPIVAAIQPWPRVSNESSSNVLGSLDPSMPRSVTEASSRHSPPSTRDGQVGYPFPITKPDPAPERPIPSRPKKIITASNQASTSVSGNRAQGTRKAREPGAPPPFEAPTPTSALQFDSDSHSQDPFDFIRGPSPAFTAKPWGQDDLDAFSSKSRPSGDTLYQDDGSSEIIRGLEAQDDWVMPKVPDTSDSTTIRDSIQTIKPSEQVQVGTAVHYAQKVKPILKEVRSSGAVPLSTSTSQYTSRNTSAYASSNLTGLIVPWSESPRSSTPSPKIYPRDALTMNPIAVSQHSVSPVDDGSGAASSGQDPSDESLPQQSLSRGTAPMVRAHSRYSSHLDASSLDQEKRPQGSRGSEVSNPFQDSNAEAGVMGRSTSHARTSHELIKESFTRATYVDRSTSSSRVANYEKDNKAFAELSSKAVGEASESGSHNETRFLSHPESTLQGRFVSQDKSEQDAGMDEESIRTCCGLPLWLFCLIILGAILIVAAAIIVPVAVLVVPKQSKSAPPSPSGTNAAQQSDTCKSVLTCENGGVSVLSSAGGCACICALDWMGPTCNEQGGDSCTTISTQEITQATIGTEIAALIPLAESQYGLPLNASILVSLFDASAVSCTSENALVAFDHVTPRALPSFNGQSRIASQASLVEIPLITPSPDFKRIQTLQTIQRRQTVATVSGLVIAVSATPPSPNVISVEGWASSSVPLPSVTSSPFSPSDPHTLNFARVVILAILQLTGNLTDAEQAQTALLQYFTQYVTSSNGSPSSSSSTVVDLGNGFSVNLATVSLFYNNNRLGG